MNSLPIGNRILLLFLRRCNSTQGVIAALLFTTMLISSVVSNFSAALLMMLIMKQYMNTFENEDDRRKVSAALMIGLIIAVGIGGICTPVGNAGNGILITVLNNAGISISFLQWMIFGVPVAVIWFPAALFLIFKLLPVPKQKDGAQTILLKQIESTIPDNFSRQEITAIIILSITAVCWVMNFNVMIVSCCCCAALLFPGFGLMTWKKFDESVGWASLLIICGMCSLISVLSSTGVMTWLIGILLGILPENITVVTFLLIMGLFIPVLLILVPNAPVLISVLGAALIEVSATLGFSPVTLIMGLSFLSAIDCVLPVGALSLLLYESGKNFKAKEMFKVTVPVIAVGIVCVLVWLPLCVNILGF